MPAVTQGISVQIDSRPEFTGYLNITSKGTSKHRLDEEIEGEDGVHKVSILNDLQDELDATLVLRTSTTEPTPGVVLTASPGSVKWQIKEVGRPYTAGVSKKVELKLKKYEGITYS